jgi:6-phosphofructokinase 2
VAKRVIVARGADGSVMAEPGRRVFAKAAKVQVVSTVGAGDSFVAGFVLQMARGLDSAQALAYGAAAASAAVTTDATQLCRIEDVERLLPECEISEI